MTDSNNWPDTSDTLGKLHGPRAPPEGGTSEYLILRNPWEAYHLVVSENT